MNFLLPAHHLPTQAVSPFLSLEDMANLKVTSKSIKAQVELLPKKKLLDEFWENSTLLFDPKRARHALELRDLRLQVNTKAEFKLIAGDFMTGFIAGAGDYTRIASLVVFMCGAGDIPALIRDYLDNKQISVFLTGITNQHGIRVAEGLKNTLLAPVVYKTTTIAQAWLFKKRGLVINFSLLKKDSKKNISAIRKWSSLALSPSLLTVIGVLNFFYPPATHSSPYLKPSPFKFFGAASLICGIAGALFGMCDRRGRMERFKYELFDLV